MFPAVLCINRLPHVRAECVEEKFVIAAVGTTLLLFLLRSTNRRACCLDYGMSTSVWLVENDNSLYLVLPPPRPLLLIRRADYRRPSLVINI